MPALLTDCVTEYAERVVSGGELVCEYHRLVCKRHLLDLERGQFVWDPEAAEFALKFLKILRHHKGRQFAGQRFIPEPWQQFLVGSLFGWKDEHGHRRYKEAYVEIPRKNGKTFLGAGIGLYGMFADREPGAEIYSIATKRDQAAICWKAAKEMVRKTPSLAARSRNYTTSLTYPASGNSFLPLSKDTKKMDGLNPHFTIGDEVHAWEDRAIYDQIDDALGSREQPLFFLITTAGENIEGVGYELREHVISILENLDNDSYTDDAYFGFITTLDEGDDWQDESTWIKANPNLGVSKSWDYLRRQVKKAQQIPSKENAVLNKQFNIWTTTGKKWLDMKAWKKGSHPIDLDRLKGQPCHVGLDLSTIQDITATVCLFPPGPYPEWTVLPHFYIPERRVTVKHREDKVPYPSWVKQGHLLTTPGDVIDLDFIKRDILTLNDTYNILDVGFDPWKAVEIATKLEEEGLEMIQMRQGFATLGAPTSDLEKKVLRKELRHAGHPVLRWMAQNTVVIRDSNENIRPDKKASRRRIDGIVALIMALGRALTKQDNTSVYDKRGFIEDDD